jgi:hypothetical protein
LNAGNDFGSKTRTARHPLIISFYCQPPSECERDEEHTLPARLDRVLQIPLVDLIDQPSVELLEPVLGAGGRTGCEFRTRSAGCTGVAGRAGFRSQGFL